MSTMKTSSNTSRLATSSYRMDLTLGVACSCTGESIYLKIVPYLFCCSYSHDTVRMQSHRGETLSDVARLHHSWNPADFTKAPWARADQLQWSART